MLLADRKDLSNYLFELKNDLDNILDNLLVPDIWNNYKNNRDTIKSIEHYINLVFFQKTQTALLNLLSSANLYIADKLNSANFSNNTSHYGEFVMREGFISTFKSKDEWQKDWGNVYYNFPLNYDLETGIVNKLLGNHVYISRLFTSANMTANYLIGKRFDRNQELTDVSHFETIIFKPTGSESVYHSLVFKKNPILKIKFPFIYMLIGESSDPLGFLTLGIFSKPNKNSPFLGADKSSYKLYKEVFLFIHEVYKFIEENILRNFLRKRKTLELALHNLQSNDDFFTFELINKVDKVNKILENHCPYSESIEEFVALASRGEGSAEELALKLINNIWKIHYKHVFSAIEILDFKNAQSVLFWTKNYRDHLIHVVKVFLLGHIVLWDHYDPNSRKNRSIFKLIMKKRKWDTQTMFFVWASVSLFHDYSMPIEKIKDVIEKYYEKFIRYKEGLQPVSYLTDVLVKQEMLFAYLHILHQKDKYSSAKSGKYCHFQNIVEHNIIDKKIVEHFISKNDHGIASALTFLTIILEVDKVKFRALDKFAIRITHPQNYDVETIKKCDKTLRVILEEHRTTIKDNHIMIFKREICEQILTKRLSSIDNFIDSGLVTSLLSDISYYFADNTTIVFVYYEDSIANIQTYKSIYDLLYDCKLCTLTNFDNDTFSGKILFILSINNEDVTILEKSQYNFQKFIKVKYDRILDFILESSSAIMHHNLITKGNDEYEANGKCDRLLPNKYFEKEPLSVLLFLCDTIQDWGRPSSEQLDIIHDDEKIYFNERPMAEFKNFKYANGSYLIDLEYSWIFQSDRGIIRKFKITNEPESERKLTKTLQTFLGESENQFVNKIKKKYLAKEEFSRHIKNNEIAKLGDIISIANNSIKYFWEEKVQKRIFFNNIIIDIGIREPLNI